MPSRPIKRDPYCDFKNDRERCLAFNVQALCKTVAIVAPAIVATRIDWMRHFDG